MNVAQAGTMFSNEKGKNAYQRKNHQELTLGKWVFGREDRTILFKQKNDGSIPDLSRQSFSALKSFGTRRRKIRHWLLGKNRDADAWWIKKRMKKRNAGTR